MDTAKIETITGLKGTLIPAENVFKVTKPRADIPVKVDGWTMPLFMGLTSWASFQAVPHGEVMVMGDFVLFEDEVNPAMSAALDNGLEVTALHNHFFSDDPHVYFMHIGGHGALEPLAGGVKAVLDAVAKIRAAQPKVGSPFAGTPPLPEKSAITPVPLESLLGAKGTVNAGMVKFVFGREVAMGMTGQAGKEMGVNTWAAFAGVDDNAVVDGDFAVHEDELQPVLKALRAEGIDIVAIHSHMTDETPRTLFLHFWGRGPAAKLAASVKKALALTAK